MDKSLATPETFTHSEHLFTRDDQAMKFSMRPCEEKIKLKPAIEHGGGTLTSKSTTDSIRLTVPGSKVLNECVSTNYIWDCIKQNKLLNIKDYKVEAFVASDISDVSDCESNISKIRISERKTRMRKEYQLTEETCILDFICTHRRYSEIRGRALWQDMERLQVAHGRTWQSMKEHFMKQMFPCLSSYNVTPQDIKNFNNPSGSYEDSGSDENGSGVDEKSFIQPERKCDDTSTSFCSYSGKRRPYSHKDDQAILNYLLKQSDFYVNGIIVWKEMQVKKITLHSWQSMKERFLKKIIPNIKSFKIDNQFKRKLGRLMESVTGKTESDLKSISSSNAKQSNASQVSDSNREDEKEDHKKEDKNVDPKSNNEVADLAINNAMVILMNGGDGDPGVVLESSQTDCMPMKNNQSSQVCGSESPTNAKMQGEMICDDQSSVDKNESAADKIAVVTPAVKERKKETPQNTSPGEDIQELIQIDCIPTSTGLSVSISAITKKIPSAKNVMTESNKTMSGNEVLSSDTRPTTKELGTDQIHSATDLAEKVNLGKDENVSQTPLLPCRVSPVGSVRKKGDYCEEVFTDVMSNLVQRLENNQGLQSIASVNSRKVVNEMRTKLLRSFTRHQNNVENEVKSTPLKNNITEAKKSTRKNSSQKFQPIVSETVDQSQTKSSNGHLEKPKTPVRSEDTDTSNSRLNTSVTRRKRKRLTVRKRSKLRKGSVSESKKSLALNNVEEDQPSIHLIKENQSLSSSLPTIITSSSPSATPTFRYSLRRKNGDTQPESANKVPPTPQDAKKVPPTPQDAKKIPSTPGTKKVTSTTAVIKNVTPTPQKTKKVVPTPQETKKVVPTPQDAKKVTPTPQDAKKVTPTRQDTKKVKAIPENKKRVTPVPLNPRSRLNRKISKLNLSNNKELGYDSDKTDVYLSSSDECDEDSDWLKTLELLAIRHRQNIENDHTFVNIFSKFLGLEECEMWILLKSTHFNVTGVLQKILTSGGSQNKT